MVDGVGFTVIVPTGKLADIPIKVLFAEVVEKVGNNGGSPGPGNP